jgi:hypothetical protein
MLGHATKSGAIHRLQLVVAGEDRPRNSYGAIRNIARPLDLSEATLLLTTGFLCHRAFCAWWLEIKVRQGDTRIARSGLFKDQDDNRPVVSRGGSQHRISPSGG